MRWTNVAKYHEDYSLRRNWNPAKLQKSFSFGDVSKIKLSFLVKPQIWILRSKCQLTVIYFWAFRRRNNLWVCLSGWYPGDLKKQKGPLNFHFFPRDFFVLINFLEVFFSSKHSATVPFVWTYEQLERRRRKCSHRNTFRRTIKCLNSFYKQLKFQTTVSNLFFKVFPQTSIPALTSPVLGTFGLSGPTKRSTKTEGFSRPTF